MDYSFIPPGVTVAVLGQGYVGTCLTRALQNSNRNLTVVPLTHKTWREDIAGKQFDYFINAAGYSGDFRANPIPTVESNISLTVEVLKTAKIHTAYLAVSSTRVYGFGNEDAPPYTEDMPLPGLRADAIDTIYDGSKILLESLVLQGCATLSIKPVVARLSNIYGSYTVLDDKTLIKKLVRLALEGQPCAVNQNPSSSKDYIHAEDAAQGMLRALFLSPSGGIYNIGSGASASLHKVADLLAVTLQIPATTGIATHRLISIEKARRQLQFSPRYTIETGLQQTLKEGRTS